MLVVASIRKKGEGARAEAALAETSAEEEEGEEGEEGGAREAIPRACCVASGRSCGAASTGLSSSNGCESVKKTGRAEDAEVAVADPGREEDDCETPGVRIVAREGAR